MTFYILADIFNQIEQTSSRVEITKLLADLFKKLSADDLEKTVYLLQGRVSPLYASSEFGMAEKMVERSIISSLQLDKSEYAAEFKKNGDVGKTALFFKERIHTLVEKDLSISEVFENLSSISLASGEGSQEKKINILSSMISALDPLSACYLVRIPLNMLRLGFSDMTILDALSWTISGDKRHRPVLQEAYHVHPDIGYIAKQVKKQGVDHIRDEQPVLFTPILMMRAERLSSGAEIIDQIGVCALEPKYDGFRVQVHYKKSANRQHKTNVGDAASVKLYSRNLEDVSYMYPDLVEGIIKQAKADEFIIEGEAIGFDANTGSFLPFQETVQRKRKYDIGAKAKEIPLKLYAFELLVADSTSYMKAPFTERRKKLETVLTFSGDKYTDTILLAPHTIVKEPKQIELMFDDAITNGLEGIVAKRLDGVYQPGARGWNWIKFKRSYSSKIDDTIDCVVMGYDYGKGKRADFGIGAFLVGVYDDVNDTYKTIAKIGTGLTDEEWRKLEMRSQKLKEKNKPTNYDVDKIMQCDIWVYPDIVVEIKADEISRSSVHTAGRTMKPTKSGGSMAVDIPGYALRFPRLVSFRNDKTATDSTSVKEIADMFDSKTVQSDK